MARNLKEYFPMIRTRKEVLEGIGKSEKLLAVFESWMDLCSGAREAKILRDSFFKKILSPEYHKDRLERFVSLVLEKPAIRQICFCVNIRGCG